MAKYKSMEKTIVLDFDGVISKYNGWNGGRIGPIIEGTIEALHKLRRMGFKLVIQTCRTHPRWGNKDFQIRYLQIIRWLNTYNVPYDEIDVFGKTIGEYYIDDRGIRFEGNWNDVITKINELESVNDELHDEIYCTFCGQRTSHIFVGNKWECEVCRTKAKHI